MIFQGKHRLLTDSKRPQNLSSFQSFSLNKDISNLEWSAR